MTDICQSKWDKEFLDLIVGDGSISPTYYNYLQSQQQQLSFDKGSLVVIDSSTNQYIVVKIGRQRRNKGRRVLLRSVNYKHNFVSFWVHSRYIRQVIVH